MVRTKKRKEHVMSQERRTTESAGSQEEIRAIERQKQNDWAARDLKGILTHYMADATVIVPNAPPAQGHAAIAALLTRPLADPNFLLTFTTRRVEIAQAGDMAYSVGNFADRLSNGDGTVSSTGHHVWIYRRQPDGGWLVETEISVRGPVPSSS
jgi:ketosteroid isomerase-like protein